MIKLHEEEKIKTKLRNFDKNVTLKDVIMDYQHLIEHLLTNNPSILLTILDELDLDEDEFFYKMSSIDQNIVFYDQVLSIIKLELNKMLPDDDLKLKSVKDIEKKLMM